MAQRCRSAEIGLRSARLGHPPWSSDQRIASIPWVRPRRARGPLDLLGVAINGNRKQKWVLYRTIGSFKDVQEEVMRGLEAIGLAGRANELARLLSYGERRQLELAFALNSNPKVLLLDEPFAGLSPSERQRISEVIAALSRSITVLMIEHDIDIALALADRVSVLHRGQVLIEGTPNEVKANPQVREVYFGRI